VYKGIGLAGLIAAMMLGSPAQSWADGGALGVAYFRVSQSPGVRTITTSFIVTNVSPRDVQVTLKLYDYNGNSVGAGGFTPTITIEGPGTGCNGTNTTCTLAAGKSMIFQVGPPAVAISWWGHGAIEWTSSTDDTQTTALVAQVGVTTTWLPAGNQMVVQSVLIGKQPF
jgi:hypothetical protein